MTGPGDMVSVNLKFTRQNDGYAQLSLLGAGLELAEEAAPPLGVSYAPAMRPPATGVRPPLLARPEGVGVFTGASVAAPAAGEPNETADSDRLGGGAEAFPPALPLDDIASSLFFW